MFRNRLSTRLPGLRDVVLVFAVVSLVVYGWTIVSIFWKLNSWRMNLTPGEIISLISYEMILSFLQSVLLVFLLIIPSLFLPSGVWKEKFMVRGTMAGLCVLASMILHLKLYGADVEVSIVQSLTLWWLVTALIGAGLIWFLPRFRFSEKLIFELADRSMVFLYMFLPATALGFVVLLIRFFTIWR